MNSAASYVLFVDDDLDDQEIVMDCCHELQKEQQARFVNSGDELFRFLSTIKDTLDLPSLIVLDINMPGINGEEVLLLLKANSRYRHIPVVFYTTGSRFQTRYLELGADGFYHKPNNYYQLRECVRLFFQRLQQTSLS
jgi:CheY-like chemotaxis protein